MYITLRARGWYRSYEVDKFPPPVLKFPVDILLPIMKLSEDIPNTIEIEYLYFIRDKKNPMLYILKD